jgi:hypothetical protein
MRAFSSAVPVPAASRAAKPDMADVVAAASFCSAGKWRARRAFARQRASKSSRVGGLFVGCGAATGGKLVVDGASVVSAAVGARASDGDGARSRGRRRAAEDAAIAAAAAARAAAGESGSIQSKHAHVVLIGARCNNADASSRNVP